MPYYTIDEENKSEEISVKIARHSDYKVYHAHTDKHSTIFGIPVTIQKEGDVFTVIDYEINMYGVGSTKEEAEEDYKTVVIEYFEDLEANEGKIGENLKKDLDYLRMKLEH